MVKLDATKLQDDETKAAESETPAAATETPPQTRVITIPTPAGAKTKVELLCLQDEAGLWWSGFQIARDYDPGKGNKKEWTELPDPEQQEENFESIILAIEDAADRATTWLSMFAKDNDTRTDIAINAVEKWIEEKASGQDAIDETIFDLADGQPAEGSDAAEAVDQADADPEGHDAEPEAGGESDQAEPTADDDFEERRRALDERIAEVSVKISRLKVQMKSLKKSLELDIDERADMEDRGPERLPLFDAKPANASESNESATTCAGQVEEIQEVHQDETQDESWKSVPLLSLDGMTPKILEVLDSHDIRTLGDLANAPSVKRCELTQLKGITETRLQKINEATERYWSTHKAQA